MLKYDHTNQRFGRLLVLEFSKGFWQCVCECGTTTFVRGGDLRSGDTKSCGCIFRETLIRRNTKHGLCVEHRKAYEAWGGAIRRCADPDNKLYGGRGVTVCKRWRASFAAFLEDMGDPLPGMTLDRKKVNRGYSKGNCRWITPRDNSNNRRNTRYLTYNGVTNPLSIWAENFEIDLGTLARRLQAGWSVERALMTTTDTRFRRKQVA